MLQLVNTLSDENKVGEITSIGKVEKERKGKCKYAFTFVMHVLL